MIVRTPVKHIPVKLMLTFPRADDGALYGTRARRAVHAVPAVRRAPPRRPAPRVLPAQPELRAHEPRVQAPARDQVRFRSFLL